MLYLICANDVDGESKDVFAYADSPEQAVELMLGYHDADRDNFLRFDDREEKFRVIEVPTAKDIIGAALGVVPWFDLKDEPVVIQHWVK
jgi:hypothetical protein